MKKHKWILLFALLLTFLNFPTYASRLDIPGFSYSFYGGGQSVNLDPDYFVLAGNEIQRLDPNHRRMNNFIWGLGAAYRFAPPNQPIFAYTNDLSVGIDVFDFQTHQQGTVFDSGSPDFKYRMTIQSFRILANTEWTFLPILNKTIYPFFEGGVGLACNTNTYNDTPTGGNPFGVGISNLKNSSDEFAWDVGLGIKGEITNNLELSLRYLYSNLGTVSSGKQSNIIIAEPYTLPLRTHSILIGLSYLR